MLTFDVEKEKLSGWVPQKPAPAAKPTRKATKKKK
jgi:hypothetical protein